MIRLHIIEDHPIIVDGIRQRLRHKQDGITLTGSSDTIEQFLKEANPETFDLIILDLWLPNRDPFENLKLIRQNFPMKPVVIFTQETNSYWIKVMMENGASAYLLKNAERREFNETLEKVFKGNTVMPVYSLDKTAPNANNTLLQQNYFLKPSERIIVVQLANGASLKSIAKNQTSTVSAIEKTLKKIRTNYNVSTNPELIRVLMEQKLI